MQGKILADGLISGNDGNRYTFTASDLKNAEGKSIHSIIGSEVDFEGKAGKASEIYITHEAKALSKDKLKSTLQNVDNALSNFDAGKAKSRIKSVLSSAGIEGLARIQKRTYIMVGCFVAGFILPFGFIFMIIALVFGILATKELQQISQSKALTKKFITLFVLIGLICMCLVYSGSGSIGSIQFMGASGSGVGRIMSGTAATAGNAMVMGAAGLAKSLEVVFKIIAIILFIPTFFVLRSYARELVFITQQRYFNFAFYIGIITLGIRILLTLPFAGILLLIALGFYVVAWVKTTQIGKSNTAIK